MNTPFVKWAKNNTNWQFHKVEIQMAYDNTETCSISYGRNCFGCLHSRPQNSPKSFLPEVFEFCPVNWTSDGWACFLSQTSQGPLPTNFCVRY